MCLGGPSPDHELTSDLPVRHSPDDELCDLQLTMRQEGYRGVRRMPGARRRAVRSEPASEGELDGRRGIEGETVGVLRVEPLGPDRLSRLVLIRSSADQQGLAG